MAFWHALDQAWSAPIIMLNLWQNNGVYFRSIAHCLANRTEPQRHLKSKVIANTWKQEEKNSKKGVAGWTLPGTWKHWLFIKDYY